RQSISGIVYYTARRGPAREDRLDRTPNVWLERVVTFVGVWRSQAIVRLDPDRRPVEAELPGEARVRLEQLHDPQHLAERGDHSLDGVSVEWGSPLREQAEPAIASIEGEAGLVRHQHDAGAV